jgi:hypothetical protein
MQRISGLFFISGSWADTGFGLPDTEKAGYWILKKPDILLI